MIISHKYKFIFFAIPKTGTHSIRFALRPYLDHSDEEHVALFHHSKFNIPEFENRNNGHFSVKEIQPHLSDEILKKYFKFCFVRNPYDRFVSTCFFKNPLIKRYPEKAVEMMKLIAQKELKKNSFFFQPQINYLLNEKGEITMDYIGKLEIMQENYKEICNKLDIPTIPLEKINSSDHKEYQFYYDDELKSLVRKLYARDFDTFLYQQ